MIPKTAHETRPVKVRVSIGNRYCGFYIFSAFDEPGVDDTLSRGPALALRKQFVELA